MISDERLKDIASFDPSVSMSEAHFMAKELEMYRKAFNEPEAWLWINDSDSGKDVSLIDPEQDDDAHDAEENGWVAHPLYRKPEI